MTSNTSVQLPYELGLADGIAWVAAGSDPMTETPRMGTFGEHNDSAVTDYLDGFGDGVREAEAQLVPVGHAADAAARLLVAGAIRCTADAYVGAAAIAAEIFDGPYLAEVMTELQSLRFGPSDFPTSW